MTFDELDTSTQTGRILHAAVAMLMLDAYTDKTPNQVMEKLTRIADEVWKPDQLHEAMYTCTIEEHVKQANETLAAVREEEKEWHEEVNPALAHALYIGGVPVEKGTGMCWTQIPWEKDGNNCPYEWFVNEAKYGAKYRKRVN